MIKKILFLLYGVIFVVSLNIVQASPIPADELFRSADTYDYRISPNGELIIKHYFRDNQYNVLELLDPDTGRKRDAFRIKVRKEAYIKRFGWVDNSTLFVEYFLGKNKHRRSFIDIDLNKFYNTDDEMSVIKKVSSKAVLVDALVHKTGRILVQKEVGDRLKVFNVSYQQFISDKILEGKVSPYHLKNAVQYYTENDGVVRLARTIEDEVSEIWYREKGTNKWISLFDFTDMDFTFQPVGFISENEIAVITDKLTDKQALVNYNFRTKEFGEVMYQHDKYDIDDASVSSKTGQLVSVSYFEQGRLVTEFYSEINKNVDSKISEGIGGLQYLINSEAINGKNRIVYAFSSSEPGQFFFYNYEKEKTIKLGPLFTNLEGINFSSSEVFKVRSENDLEIEAILTKPKKSNGVLLVWPHGGPVGVRDTDTFSRENQYFASRGYSILNVNFRGSHGYGKKFLKEGQGEFGKKIEKDISSAVSIVREKYKFEHMCSIGHSYGGYSALILAAYSPKKYDCAIGRYGVYDLPLLFNATNYAQKKAYKEAVEFQVGEYKHSLKDYSPVYFAEKISAPVLLIAGKLDPIAHIEQSNRMKYRLKQLNKDVEYLFYDKVGHSHSNWYWDRHQSALIDEFIARKLNLSSNLNNESLLASELMMIADAYNFDDIVENDYTKAFELYKRAAELDDPRGNFNVGAFLYDGNHVDKNLAAASNYYKRASDLGYAQASFNLAEMYSEAEHFEKNTKKALEYFRLASKQKHKSAEFELAFMQCAYGITAKDVDECIEILEADSKNNYSSTFKVAQKLFFDERISASVKQRVSEVLEKMSYVNLATPRDFKITEEGLYRSRPRGISYYHDETSFNVEVDYKSAIGFDFTVADVEDREYLLKLTWESPEPKNQEKEAIKIQRFMTVRANEKSASKIYFNFEKTKISGVWKVKVQNWGDEILYEREFQIEVLDE